jgi:hypothetical protein
VGDSGMWVFRVARGNSLAQGVGSWLTVGRRVGCILMSCALCSCVVISRLCTRGGRLRSPGVMSLTLHPKLDKHQFGVEMSLCRRASRQ